MTAVIRNRAHLTANGYTTLCGRQPEAEKPNSGLCGGCKYTQDSAKRNMRSAERQLADAKDRIARLQGIIDAVPIVMSQDGGPGEGGKA